MTDEQIILIKRTWKLLRDVDPVVVGDTFYGKLFSDNPSLRKMFPVNMSEQYRKLMDMLTLIVSRLDRLDDMSEEISKMARRHVSYGVRPGHYRLVGKALLWTLHQGLGRDWTVQVGEAWNRCYTILSETMIKASGEADIKNISARN